jgi:hypothetical protein
MGVGVNCSRPEQATNKKQNGSSRMGLKQRSWKIANMMVVIILQVKQTRFFVTLSPIHGALLL